MEYEQLSKSYEYGLSKIYEMVINNNPSYAYLLEGNSLVDQKLVMAHVYGHVDFFKNNYCFSKTNRKMIDEMANHATRVRRHIERLGIEKVESFIDACLSLENLIDPMSPFIARKPAIEARQGGAGATSGGRAGPGDPAPPGQGLHGQVHQPAGVPRGAEARSWNASATGPRRFPDEPERDVLLFLLEHAPLEPWERDVLAIVRDEAYYFAPQGQTKIMNEGWATYWHSKIMTEKALKASEIIDYADHNAGVLATAPGQLNPYKLGIELLRDIEERWNKGQFGKEWDECEDLDAAPELGQAARPRPQEDLRGAQALQRRHLHRRVLHRRLLRAQEVLLLLGQRAHRATTRSRRASSRR